MAEPVTLTPCARALVEPSRLWSRAEVLSKVAAVPSEPGVYAWYFRRAPGETPVDGCLVHQGFYLLYVGISPGTPKSTQNLRKRIWYHLTGNAEGSTLRLTLGCLLAAELGIELRRVGSGTRFTFAAGEKALSQWMADNALVIWCVTERPRDVEHELMRNLVLPLNLESNARSGFAKRLSAIRSSARKRARELPVVTDDDRTTSEP